MLNKIENYIKSKLYWKDYYKLEYKHVESLSARFRPTQLDKHIIRLTNTKTGKWVSEIRYIDTLNDEVMHLQCDYLIKMFEKYKLYEVE